MWKKYLIWKILTNNFFTAGIEIKNQICLHKRRINICLTTFEECMNIIFVILYLLSALEIRDLLIASQFVSCVVRRLLYTFGDIADKRNHIFLRFNKKFTKDEQDFLSSLVGIIPCRYNTGSKNNFNQVYCNRSIF